MPVYMASKTCPRCGAPVEPGLTTCPNCRAVLKKKNALTPYLVIAGLIVVIIIVVAVVMMSPAQGPGPVTTIAPVPAVQPASAGTNADASNLPQPTCTIGITGSRVSSSTIRLQVMTGTCSPGDITALRVSINGAAEGTLGTGPGASATFPSSGTGNVVVTAKFANGAESVEYQNPAL
jgi:predicted nucleic acid-binding Zn ribbon protein